MGIEELLTIVIPSKNEEGYIGTTLKLLCGQHIGRTPIIIADANSTDGTRRIVSEFKDRLNVKAIDGGLPSYGRNAGASLALTKYVLFIDADCQLREKSIIANCLNLMESKGADIATAKVTADGFLSKVLYRMNNVVMALSKLDKPFAVGTFMMVRKSEFDRIGGFDESALHCEDYVLSRQFDRKKFHIVNSMVVADDRRFRKTGHVKYVLYVLKNAWNRNNPDYFKQDVGYWR